MRTFLSSLLLAAYFSYFSAQAQWQQTSGPEGGSFSCLASNGTTLFGVVNNAENPSLKNEIYYSNDNGDSWNIRTTSFRTLTLAANGSVVLAGTKNGLFRSMDNGVTWNSTMPDTAQVDVYSVGKTMYAIISGASGRNYRSSDNGTTWVAFPVWNKVQSLAGNDSITFASTSSKDAIFRSTDKGITWDSIPMPKDIITLHYHRNTLFYVSSYEKVYRSSDNGTTWTNSTIIPQYRVFYLGSNATALFVLSDNGAIRSTDTGTTWTELTNGLQKSTSYYEARIYTNIGNTVFIANSTIVYRSTTNGDSWNPLSSKGIIGTRILNLIPRSSGILAGGMGGVFSSTDKGASWVRTGFSTYTTCLAAKDSLIIAFGGFKPHHSTDNGRTWMPPDSGKYKFPATCAGIEFTSKGIFIGLGSGGTGSGYGYVERSVDSGKTWEKQGDNIDYIESFGAKGDTIFVGTNGLGIFRSTDFGKTWEHVYCCAYIFSLWLKGNSLYSSASNIGIIRSTDGGTTWLPVGKPRFISHGFAAKGASLFAIGIPGVWRSDDGGDIWYDVSGDLPKSSILSLAVLGTTLFAGTSNTGVWKAEIADLLPAAVYELPLQSNAISIYPNPAQDEITILLPDNSQNSAPIRCRLLTSDGRTARENTFADVSGRVTLPLEGIAAGIYALEIRTGVKCLYSTVVVNR